MENHDWEARAYDEAHRARTAEARVAELEAELDRERELADLHVQAVRERLETRVAELEHEKSQQNLRWADERIRRAELEAIIRLALQEFPVPSSTAERSWLEDGIRHAREHLQGALDSADLTVRAPFPDPRWSTRDPCIHGMGAGQPCNRCDQIEFPNEP